MSESFNNQRIAFVTGGSGFVGARLIQVLIRRGWAVRALARSASAASAIAALGAEPVIGALNDAAALQKGMAGSEVVFHIAALFKLWGKRSAFDKVNVDGMRAVVDTASGTPSVKKVVAVSAAAVVQGDPEAMVGIDERLALQDRPFSPYGSSKAAGEKILLSANGRRPLFETIAIRPPMIWGAGMPMLDQIVEAVREGHWQWVDHGEQPTSTCHLDNLVDALVLAADHGRGGEAYFVADAENGTFKSIVSDLLATRHVRAPDKSVSFGMAWAMAGVLGVVWGLFHLKGEPPITRQMLRLIGKPFTLRWDKAKRDLGYSPRITWKAGIAEIAALQERG